MPLLPKRVPLRRLLFRLRGFIGWSAAPGHAAQTPVVARGGQGPR